MFFSREYSQEAREQTRSDSKKEVVVFQPKADSSRSIVERDAASSHETTFLLSGCFKAYRSRLSRKESALRLGRAIPE